MSTHVILNTGAAMPLVGLGTWKSKPGAVANAVECALRCGYRHIDAAAVYANEAEVGAGIAAFLATSGDERPPVTRGDLFVTSKLWNSEHHPDDVEAACRKTLADLGLEYLDLFLVHWPCAFQRGQGHFPRSPGSGRVLYAADVAPSETWAAMEALVAKGLVRAIGLSNFNAAQVDAVCAAATTVQPAVLQVECHPLLNQAPLIAHARKNGMAVMGYSPLGSGKAGLLAPEQGVAGRVVARVAAAHPGKSAAQVLLRYQVQRGVCVIPKSVTPARIAANRDVWDFALSAEEMAALDALDEGKRFVAIWSGERVPQAPHPRFPFADAVVPTYGKQRGAQARDNAEVAALGAAQQARVEFLRTLSSQALSPSRSALGKRVRA